MLGAGFKGASEKLKGLFGKGGKGGGGKKLKVTNIIESIDVGVPIDLAYNQWTQFTEFPSFMKKVENVEQAEDEKLHWKAQVLWSHREWDADIIEQIPDQRIVWQSKGAKGHVDGAVTFHELAPELTRILLVLEYHPQGFFEHTGNLWRAQGRRARLELKHFRRHLMTNAILHPEEIEGWRGVIEDGEVVQDDEAARAEEERGGDEAEGREQDDELADEAYAEDRGEDVEDEDLDDEGVEDEGVDDEGVEDEYQVPDAEDEDVSPNGQAARERLARTTGGSSPAGRGRRPTGRQQGSSRSSREEGRPQRSVRRRAGTRGGNSQ
jgi:polyketide cyclase/dehydrase/lipid transport protein